MLIALTVAATNSPLICDGPESWDASVYVGFAVRTIIVAIGLVLGRWLFFAVDRTASIATRLEESRSDFLLAVAHQLKTPLSSLRAALEAVRREPDTIKLPGSRETRALEVALRSERKLERQLERLLDFFRLESGQADFTFQKMALSEPATAALELVRPQLEAKGQVIGLDLPSDLPQVTADSDRVETVLIDLLRNAVDFTPDGGRITLWARPWQRRTVLVKVFDTGPGVAMLERSRIFEPFYQSATAPAGDRRRGGSGTGLGLAIAKSIVQLHGGQIWQEPGGDGHGAFCFTLPCAQ